jgi:hypothetical protein
MRGTRDIPSFWQKSSGGSTWIRTGGPRWPFLRSQRIEQRYGACPGADRSRGAGGWAVWRHGYLGRVAQDVDVVVAAGVIDDLLRAAAVSGFLDLSPFPPLFRRTPHPEALNDPAAEK